MFDDESVGYRRFWTQLLDTARGRTDLHARITPSNNWWIGATRSGIAYDYALRKDAAYVELWIDKGSAETNEAIFQGLLAHKGEIEKAFGKDLVWHRACGRGRAVQFFASRYGFDHRERWPEIQAALIDAMIRLDAACSPYLYRGSPRVVIPTPATVSEVSNDRDSQPINTSATSAKTTGDIITMAHLKAGIAEFKRRWPGESDFNNRLYRELSTRRDSGRLTWVRLVDELSGWRALRTSLPGHDKGWYLARGEEPFRRMLVLAARIQSAHAGRDPIITETSPEELSEMFEIAIDIKNVSSPVFASKLCHFLMPSAFPVADQDMLGISTVDRYWKYWKACAEGWRVNKEKEALKAHLRDAMSTTPFVGYPWAVKVAELCHAGTRPWHN
jgi:hypothetical protein